MEIDIIALVKESPALALFLVIALGYILGNIPLGRVKLGPVAGVLLAGLAFGHLGFQIPARVQELGFILFIYSVGLQAGPRFFAIFLSDGFKYAALAGVTALAAVGSTILCMKVVGISSGLSAGLLSGALTSSPTLAAAQDAVGSGLAGTPAGRTAAEVMSEISVGYAITYIFGLLGLLAAMRLLPRLLGLDMEAQAAALAKERRIREDEGEDPAEGKPMMRAFEVVNNEVVGRPLGDLHLGRDTGCVLQHVKRGKEFIVPDADTVLAMGDLISVVGPGERLRGLERHIGPGVFDVDLLRPPVESVVVIVTNSGVAGKSIGDLHTLARYGCFVTRVIRAQIELPVTMDIVLEKGDAVHVSGLRDRLEELVKVLGYVERRVIQTDLMTFALGIVFGLVLGKITVKVGGFALGMGAAGGLLLSGILIGFLRSIHPTFGRVPPAARWVFMEMGLLFFMAGVGLNAGGSIIEALKVVGLPLFLSGVGVTLFSLAAGLAFGRFVLRLPPALLFGAMAGAMTSTPALSVATNQAHSSIPALGYAGAYPFANIFLALGGTLLMYL